MIKRLEDAIPTKYKYSISKQEVENYEKLFREQRIRFTKDGMMTQWWWACFETGTLFMERTRFECSLEVNKNLNPDWIVWWFEQIIW